MVYMSKFKSKVLAVVKSIPSGETLSYQEVARLAGSPRAYRSVGSIMKANFDPDVPCHRVIRSNGQVGQYNRLGGSNTKRQRLMSEGCINLKDEDKQQIIDNKME
ncbi:MGMT family protein [Candidatus Nomurabacteria bacterium]|nr:MGMT family protein [Candidatus Nomurabacteria bacterium]